MIDPTEDIRRRPLVLCIEDEADLRSDLVEELEAADYAVLEAGSGEAALALLARETPDLVLCDVTMPGLSGYDVLRTLRERRPDLADVPFVFLTALADRKDVVEGKRAGADDYLVKPIDYDVLLATLKARLEQVARIRRKSALELEQTRAALVDVMAEEARQGFFGAAEAMNQVVVGIVLLASDLRVKFVNTAAQQILDENDGLILSNNSLRGATSQQTAELKRLIEGVMSDAAAGARAVGRGAAIARPSGQRPLLVFAYPLKGAAAADADRPTLAIYVTDPERRPALTEDTASSLYGLTPTEARLAVALADGGRLDDIARDFGVAPTTVTFHLRNLFRKTQTSRQADLVALLLTSPIIIEPSL